MTINHVRDIVFQMILKHYNFTWENNKLEYKSRETFKPVYITILELE